MLTDRSTADVLDAAPDLKVVANIAVGYDNIDVAAAHARGIVVTNTPDVLTEATAELTWALILGDPRRVGEGDGWCGAAAGRAGRSTSCSAWSCGGKQLGIIGRGRIGRAVAAKAPAFGMTAVFAARERATARICRAVARRAARHAPTSSRFTRRCTPATRHLIDRRALARMKRSAYLVNTARGPVVDEEALAWALKEHLIAGAALDVYEREPEVSPACSDLENVVLAPHLGSATRETRTAMADLAVRNVARRPARPPPLTPVIRS